jgi:hypothetical protein
MIIGSGNKGITLADNNPIGWARLDWSGITGGNPTFKLPNLGSGNFTLCTTSNCPSAIPFVRQINSPNTAVNLGYVAGGAGESFMLLLCMYGDRGSPCKFYPLALGDSNGGAIGWTTVYALGDDGASPGGGYNVDVDWQIDASNNAWLRVRSSGASAGTIYVSGRLLFSGSVNWVDDTTQSTPPVPANIAKTTVITQTNGQVRMPGGKYPFASLGPVPPAGTFAYCTDCTIAPMCTGGGSGHMAVSNGTNWTCQ